MYISAPIGKWIARLYKDHDQFVDELLEKHNLNHSEGNILIHLYKDGDGINQKALEECLGVDKATVSRSIKTLLRKKYLRRNKSPSDGRANLIYLSKKAEEKREEIEHIYQQWFKIFLREIPEEDAEVVIKTLKKMYQMVQNS
ncbi:MULTISPECIES: MarR family winged helix-turn-helix transcriptional regulator [unclassified Halanaerobium]|uniref:MarR family winged helix-turn-helix transcriptional regulator n=1 Tax=unclassified Halanaerobium TaxID=2641197 RepID=UPI000DF37CDE|nr:MULTISPECIES: MarR family winged helix-turn-helix transcriptional regulator [unclassified Halanaerobium]RCW47660.1 DNA-binding MarR family transcriptional regulator [Halanaerobium sp. MA284_MarDTE_T2]RCW84696.1 DNA-binding MarR family transcriptional regulator [Halanaerobium sp. DL-01]